MADRTLDAEVLVVGAGPAGIAAACAAAEAGRRVTVLDSWPSPGGQIWRGRAPRGPWSTAGRWLDRLRQSGAQLISRATVVAAPAERVLLAEVPGGSLCLLWRRLILATGARELFLPFPGWTLPGVVGPGGLQVLAKSGWPVGGRRVVVAGSGPLLLAAAAGLKQHGAKVALIAEQAPLRKVAGFALGLLGRPLKIVEGASLKLALRGVRYRCGCWPIRAQGDERVRAATLTDGVSTWAEQCDYLACAFGLTPNVELPLLVGCEVVHGLVRVDALQRTTVADVFCAGEPTGVGGVDCALVEGWIAGLAAADQADAAGAWSRRRASWHRFRDALARAFALRPELRQLAALDTVVCRCEDVRRRQLEPYTDWRSAKLHTRLGMGPCQGRVCGGAVRHLFGWEPDSVRPPILPVAVSSLLRPEPVACDPTSLLSKERT